MTKLFRHRRTTRPDPNEKTEPKLPQVQTAWDYYNKKAKIHDNETIKDWNETLSNLLIFVSLPRRWFATVTDG